MFSQAQAATLTVNSDADAGGTCPGATCTLRQAIVSASPGDTINFAPGITTINLTLGEFLINKNLTINGPGANLLSVQRSAASGTPAFRIFNITVPAMSVRISGLTIANGSSSVGGGGIYNDSTSLSLTNVTISGHSAFGGGGIYNAGYVTIANSTISGNLSGSNGGGIYVGGGGQLFLTNVSVSSNMAAGGGGIYNDSGDVTVTNSTISGNLSGSNGGGIYNKRAANLMPQDPGGTLSIENSTISGNTTSSAAGGGGGGIYNLYLSPGGFAELAFYNCTIFGNSTTGPSTYGGGVFDDTSSMYIRNSIIAGNTAISGGPDFKGTPNSAGFNLIGNNSGATITPATGDQIGTPASPIDPMLGPLQDNGGPTRTHAPLAGSKAIDKGYGNSSTDQRGFTRPIDSPAIANATGGDGDDIGAYEVQPDQLVGCSDISLLVNNTSDGGAGSLRAIIANACGGSTITFAANVRGAINLTSGELLINKNLTINGPGARLLSVQRSAASGTPSFRIFHIVNAKVVISGLTVAGGQVSGNSFPASYGGGILNEEDTLTLSKCVLSGNSASSNGGAILNYRGVLNLANCTLDQNSASGSGGAILNADYSGGSSNQANLVLTNCTLNKNQAGQYGGAIYSDGTSSGYSTLTLTNCTLNQNTAALGAGGIYNDALNPGSSGTAGVVLENTILLAGASGANLVNDGGTIVSGGHNLSSDAVGGPAGTGPGGFLNATGDIRNTDPQLDPAGLTNNGGPTGTVALLSGSPARDSGGDALAPETDQRGYVRMGVSDIGSFEFGGTLPPTLIPVCVSRKLHASFVGDIPLPRSGALGVECRTGGASSIHQVIMTFPGTVTVTDASVTTGVGGVSSFSVSGPEVTVNLTGVSNAQKIMIRLFGVSDGIYTNDVDVPMGVLLGDTSGNGSVNATDVSQTKSKSGQAVDNTNFRTDVTVSNSISSSDVSTVKAKSGTALPP